MIFTRLTYVFVISALISADSVVASASIKSSPPASCLVPNPSSPAEYNQMLGQVDGWKAGDGASTVMVDHGRRLWGFGDSILSDNRMHHNALVVQTNGCAESVKKNAPVIPSSLCGDNAETPEEESFCWSGPITYQRNRVYMVAPIIDPAENCTGLFCFSGIGTKLITFALPDYGVPSPISAVTIPETGSGISWTSAIAMFGTTDLLVYGNREDGEPWTFGRDIYVAKLPLRLLSAAGSPSSWTAWNGQSWGPLASAQSLIDPVGGPEDGFSVNRESNGTWSLVSTADGAFGHLVTRWSANRPTGPWAVAERIADWPDSSNHMYYLASRIAGSARYVVSQNWTGRPWQDLLDYPEDFRVIVF